MYKSPIEIICGDIKKQIDNDIYRVTQKYDIRVDKNELIQALAYDRDQYEKGYADGKRDAMDELVRCKDCKFGKLDTAHRKKTIDGEYDEVGFYACCKGWLANDYNKGEHFCSYGERKDDEKQTD